MNKNWPVLITVVLVFGLSRALIVRMRKVSSRLLIGQKFQQGCDLPCLGNLTRGFPAEYFLYRQFFQRDNVCFSYY